MGLLDRIAPRRADGASAPRPIGEHVFGTRALRKFVAALTCRPAPVVLDIGPAVGSNVNFFGEQLGCKIFVEDILSDLDRHTREERLDAFPEFLRKRLPQADGAVDGILCWDIIDYLDRPAAQALAVELTRVLRPEGALLAYFGTTQPDIVGFTKFVVRDEGNLSCRHYGGTGGRKPSLANRDIIRLFPDLRVSESFLLQNKLRELLFRKPA
jgi:hypothetical protein